MGKETAQEIARMREALIWNQTSAVRCIMDLQEAVRDLEMERDALAHANKCLRAEVHGLNSKLALALEKLEESFAG